MNQANHQKKKKKKKKFQAKQFSLKGDSKAKQERIYPWTLAEQSRVIRGMHLMSLDGETN